MCLIQCPVRPHPGTYDHVCTIVQATWLIFADLGKAESEAARGLGAQLTQDGQTVVFVGSKEVAQEGDYAKLLGGLQGELAGVVHALSLNPVSVDAAYPTIEEVRAAEKVGTQSLLWLVQALVAASLKPKLWLLTRGVQSTEAKYSADTKGPGLDVAHSQLWGVGKVLALEHPAFHTTRIDLALEPSDDEAAQLWAEVSSTAGKVEPAAEEQEVAFRGPWIPPPLLCM